MKVEGERLTLGLRENLVACLRSCLGVRDVYFYVKLSGACLLQQDTFVFATVTVLFFGINREEVAWL